MKRIILLLLLLCTTILAETDTLYAFSTTNNKIVRFLYDKSDSIFIYQFVSKGKVDLEVVDDLKDQDTIFIVDGYNRGGGCRNAAMSFNDVMFTVGDYTYDVYYRWAIDEEECEKNPDNPRIDPAIYGVTVAKNGKVIADIKGKEVLVGYVNGWSFMNILPQANEY